MYVNWLDQLLMCLVVGFDEVYNCFMRHGYDASISFNYNTILNLILFKPANLNFIYQFTNFFYN